MSQKENKGGQCKDQKDEGATLEKSFLIFVLFLADVCLQGFKQWGFMTTIETNKGEQLGAWYKTYMCNFRLFDRVNQLTKAWAGNSFWPKDPKNIADVFCSLFREPSLKNEDGSLRTRILTKKNVVSFMYTGVFDPIRRLRFDPDIIHYFKVIVIQDIVYFFAEVKNEGLMLNDFFAVTFDEEAKKFIRQRAFHCIMNQEKIKEEDKEKLLEFINQYLNS